MSVPTFIELKDILLDNNACIRFLFYQGILYTEYVCPNCERDMSLQLERGTWRCGRKRCRKEVSIRKDSFFADHNLKFSEIMMMGYYWLVGNPVIAVQKMTGHSTKTVTAFFKYFCQLVSEVVEEEDTIIDGSGIVVEIDESKLGKRKYNRGHWVEGVWVLGGVERTAERKTFLCSVPDRTAETLLGVITQHVMPGSIVMTDMWRSYARLVEHGYDHRTVNHSVHFRDPETGTHTNTIEGTWNGVKLCVAPRNRTREDIDEHLMEFIWRRRNQADIWQGFLNALRDISFG